MILFSTPASGGVRAPSWPRAEPSAIPLQLGHLERFGR